MYNVAGHFVHVPSADVYPPTPLYFHECVMNTYICVSPRISDKLNFTFFGTTTTDLLRKVWHRLFLLDLYHARERINSWKYIPRENRWHVYIYARVRALGRFIYKRKNQSEELYLINVFWKCNLYKKIFISMKNLLFFFFCFTIIKNDVARDQIEAFFQREWNKYLQRCKKLLNKILYFYITAGS